MAHRPHASRTPRRQAPAKARKRNISTLIIAVIAVLVLVAVLVGAAMVGKRVLGGTATPADFPGPGHGSVLVEVPAGAGVSSLGPELLEKNVIASVQAFDTAAANNPESANLLPGFVQLKEEMRAADAVAALLDPSLRAGQIDIPNGTTLLDNDVVGGSVQPGIYSLIAQATCVDRGSGEATCLTVEDLQNVAATTDPAELGVPDWAHAMVVYHTGDPRRLEGLIASGIHSFDPGLDAAAILRQLVTDSARQYDESGLITSASAIGFTPYELIVMASLVEREAPAGDFDKVARVILNRLDVGQRLEFDSTVNYGLESTHIGTSDEARATETAWNTYAKDGLPETPIASPSLAAVTAMEHPADGPWLYFVTVDTDGTTEFNETFEQHLESVQKAYDNGVFAQ